MPHKGWCVVKNQTNKQTLPLLSHNILAPIKGDNQHLPVIVLQPDIIIVHMVCSLLLVPKSPNFTLPLLSRNILAPIKGDNQHLPVIVLQPDIIIVLIVCNLLLVPKSPNFTLPLLSRNILAPDKGDNQLLPVIVLQPDIIIVLIVCNLLLVPKSPNFTFPLLSRNILAPVKNKKFTCKANLGMCFLLLSCPPRVTVASCFVDKVIRGLESIDPCVLILSTG